MRTSRTLPVVAIALLLGGLLTACDPTPGPEPTGTGTETPSSSEEPTPDPSESDDPEPEPEPEPAPSLDAADRANIRAAIESGNTAALEGYFANPVEVIIMSTECCGGLSPVEAAAELSYVTGAPGPWNWSVPASTLAEWRTNTYYGSLFTGDDITGVASDGTVVSFGIVGDRITTVLMGWDGGFDL